MNRAACALTLILSASLATADPLDDEAVATFQRERSAALGASKLDAVAELLDRFRERAEADSLAYGAGEEIDEATLTRAEFVLAEGDAALAKALPAGREKTARFESARALYERIGLERGQPLNLVLFSYVGHIETLLELGRPKDALEGSRELCEVVAPWTPRDPEQRHRMDELVSEVSLRAHLLGARSAIALRKFQTAVAFTEAARTHPIAARCTRDGLRAEVVFEQAKAFVALGRVREALGPVYSIVRRAQATPKSEHLEGIGMSRLGAAACVVLADATMPLSRVTLDPGVQFHVGLGHQLKGETVAAIAAYKRVLTAARGPEARREWVPRAIRKFGPLLWEQARYVETAIAYEALIELDPQATGETDAPWLALHASRRAIEQFEEDPADASGPLVRMRDRIERKALLLPGSRKDVFVRRAKDLERRGRWEDAAAAHLEVGSPRHLVKAGACYLRADALDRAREVLEPLLLDQETHQAAAVFLAEVEVRAKQPKAALKALDAAERTPAANIQRALANLALGEIGQLEATLTVLYANPPKDPVRLSNCAREVAEGLVERARQASDLTTARMLRAKAAAHFTRWLDAVPHERLQADHLFWAAEILFNGGRYAEARKTYDALLARFPPSIERASDYDLARSNLGWCLVELGEHAKAYQLLTELRETVYVYDRDGALLRRGVFKEEQVEHGRRFLVVDFAGEPTWFHPIAGDAHVGFSHPDDVEQGWLPQATRTLRRPLARDPLVASGLLRAAWAHWQAKRDPGFLARNVTEAANHMHSIVRNLPQDRYLDLVRVTQITPLDLETLRWQVDLLYLRIKLARQQWRHVISDLETLKLLSKVRLPAWVQAELKEIRREANQHAR